MSRRNGQPGHKPSIREETMRSTQSHPLRSQSPRSGFTLVELLVVIAIIGVLVALILPAVTGGLRRANQTRILVEIQQMDAALKDYKNDLGSFPPNAQTDNNLASASPNAHIDGDKILRDFKKHLKKAFPSHREPDELIRALVGQGMGTNPNLQGGMNAAEALVFWLGGFSSDPKYPISGIGGPSYSLTNLNGADPNEADPIENRSWRLDVDISALGPRDANNFFDETDSRFIVYDDPQNPAQQRRINFWYLKAPKSEAPYAYFDTSRATSADQTNDVPAAVDLNGSSEGAGYDGPDADALNELCFVHAVKRISNNASAENPNEYANNDTFQILHPGLDDAWGVFPIVEGIETAANLVNSEEFHEGSPTNNLPLVFPDGPWTLDLADTLTNFANDTLENAQP